MNLPNTSALYKKFFLELPYRNDLELDKEQFDFLKEFVEYSEITYYEQDTDNKGSKKHSLYFDGEIYSTSINFRERARLNSKDLAKLIRLKLWKNLIYMAKHNGKIDAARVEANCPNKG